MTTPATLEHGYGRYQKGCRCDKCVTANRTYTREWRARVRAAGLAADDRRHGTANGYENFGCRCDLCVAAHCRSLSSYWLRRARRLERSGAT